MTRYPRRPYKPSPAGRVLAWCTLCQAKAVAKGDGSPVSMTHADDCPERAGRRTE